MQECSDPKGLAGAVYISLYNHAARDVQTIVHLIACRSPRVRDPPDPPGPPHREMHDPLSYPPDQNWH